MFLPKKKENLNSLEMSNFNEIRKESNIQKIGENPRASCFKPMHHLQS
jgi:hypothetical protein